MASVTAKSRFGADVSDLSRQPGHHSDPLAGLLTPFRSSTVTGRTLYAIVKNGYKFSCQCNTAIKACNTDYGQNIAHEKKNCNSFCQIFQKFQYLNSSMWKIDDISRRCSDKVRFNHKRISKLKTFIEIRVVRCYTDIWKTRKQEEVRWKTKVSHITCA